jgi:hypothetical protein
LGFTKDHRRTSCVADTAVTVGATGRVGICFVTVANIGLVLVIVMTEMLSGSACLMLAIDANRRPSELKRQKYQQENSKEATHG